MSSKSILATLQRDRYERFLKDGLVIATKYLSLLPYPKTGPIGWIGYDKNEQGNKVRVFEKNGKYYSTWKAQYLGEVFFRFPHTHTSWAEFTKGGAKKFIIAHYPIENHKMVEELIYFTPNSSSIITKINEAVRKYNINPHNAHEFVFRLWKYEWGIGKYDLDIYFHDIDLPPIGEDNCNRTAIQRERTGNDTKFLWFPESASESLKTAKTERIRAVVDMLKKTLIPRSLHRPQEDDYIEWFHKFGGVDLKDAKKLYEYRDEWRLP